MIKRSDKTFTVIVTALFMKNATCNKKINRANQRSDTNTRYFYHTLLIAYKNRSHHSYNKGKIMTAHPTSKTKVWDLPTRLFHWSLVLCVACAWLSGEFGGFDLPIPGFGPFGVDNMTMHAVFGTAVLALVFFRILWGLWGSDSARFATFIKGPKHVLAYAKKAKTDSSYHYGHNPMGALMVVGLLSILVFQVISGYFGTDDVFFNGPLSDLVSSETSQMITGLHEAGSGLIAIMVALHVAAVVIYKVIKKQDLIKAMITGYMPGRPSFTIKLRHPLFALITFALAVAAALVLFYWPELFGAAPSASDW
jgi:cytochrome b